ncbi:hypothetical protein CsatA_013461 [Cannabis sativa]
MDVLYLLSRNFARDLLELQIILDYWAISVLHQVVLRAPVTPDAYHTLGLAHDALGDKKRAFGFYLLAAHLMSKDSTPWKMLVYWSM